MKAAAAAAMLTAATALASCGQTEQAQRSGRQATEIPVTPPTWTPCSSLPTISGIQTPAGLECATLQVPLDYSRPRGRHIGLALIRVRATDPAHRIGSLIFNFGGPGGSGVTQFANGAPNDYKTLRTRYDLVSFDPRGVGRSAPILCVDDKTMDAMQQQVAAPATRAQIAAFLRQQQAYVKACKAHSSPLLPYVGTLNAARDMEMMRRALGDKTMHYFGVSYGTWLGGNYAHQYPASVGRAVLDGAVDTKLDPVQLSLQQAAAFDRALGDYAAWAATQSDAPAATKDAVITLVGSLLNGLENQPMSTRTPRKLSQALGMSGVTEALYSKRLWPVLSTALTLAGTGDGTLLLRLADVQNGRNDDGTYDNSQAANTAIRCADTSRRYTLADVQAALPRFAAAAPTFGTAQAWGMLQCTGWPVPGDDAAQQVNAPGAPPVIVVGNLGDPATPYAWTPALAKELGSGVVLTLKGEGHGAYDTGDACIRHHVDAYLLTGVVPASGTTCPTDA